MKVKMKLCDRRKGKLKDKRPQDFYRSMEEEQMHERGAELGKDEDMHGRGGHARKRGAHACMEEEDMQGKEEDMQGKE